MQTSFLVGAWLLVWYLIPLACAVAYKTLDSSGGEASGLGRFETALFGTLLLGALGSVVTATFRFVSHGVTQPSESSPGDTGRWTTSRYLFSPFLGMLLASFFFIGMRAGVLSIGNTTPDEIKNLNVYLFAAISAGLFSDAAYRKLEELAHTLFATSSTTGAGDGERHDAPQTNGQNRLITIAPATELDELEEVFHFRYNILVEREGLKLRSSDPETKTVTDDYDEHAYILTARLDHGELRGTVRTVLWRGLPRSLRSSEGIPDLLHEHGVQLPTSFPTDICSYSSRLVVSRRNEFGRYAPDMGDLHSQRRSPRHTPATALCTALYSYGMTAGIHVDWITCVDADLPFYQKLGYRQLPGAQTSSRSPQSYVMFLLMTDRRHLEERGSPFVPYCKEMDSGVDSEELLVALQEGCLLQE